MLGLEEHWPNVLEQIPAAHQPFNEGLLQNITAELRITHHGDHRGEGELTSRGVE